MAGSPPPFVLGQVLPSVSPAVVTAVEVVNPLLALWSFDQPVTRLSNAGADLLQIAANGGIQISQNGPSAVTVSYGSTISIGQAWEVVDTVPGLSPSPAAGQSGVVT